MDMKRERARRLTDALGAVDSRYIEEARGYAGSARSRRRSVYTALLAAVLCVAILAGAMIAAKLGEDNDVNIPRYKNSFLSAKDIAGQFPVYDSVGTNRYTKIYAPDADSIYADAIPESEYVPVYSNPAKAKRVKMTEFKKFADAVIPRIESAFGLDLSGAVTREDDDTIGIILPQTASVMIRQFSGDLKYGGDSYNTVHVREDEIMVDNQTVSFTVNQYHSDQEIIDQLESSGIKDAIFEVFDVSFDAVKVVRSYSSGASRYIYVTYYNSEDILAQGDYIELGFANFRDEETGKSTAPMAKFCDVVYRDYRADTDELYYPEAYCERISLEEAEELLLNGYVFANHVCSYCMQQQDLVVFEDYDKVGFEYLKGEDYYIPFYVFFKYIGKVSDLPHMSKDAEDMNVYAKTYVCAIRVPDMDEYMESQTQYHKKIDDVMGSY